MKKCELLCPVGNKEMLEQAIHNGADAVYLSGNFYGARKFATNFNNDELVAAIKYAHLYDVKVYVTVNTLIYESEVDDFIKYVGFLHQNNVDAILVQDIGMMNLIHEKYPNLEIHASTQAHNHNIEGINYFKKLGIKRVVLDREMSLEEINSIDTDIEKEVFVYGALCVCYSGCCLFSSLNGGRSGNRGECVGSCRLPYKLLKNGEKINDIGDYPISMRELNTLPKLKELLDSNIASLKIEGRMKSPYYVGYITRIYRTLVDKFYRGEEMVIKPEELINLQKLFNRKFTTGFLFNDKDVSNIETPNHQGYEIGKVIKVTNKYIYIKLTNDSLNQEDGIRFKFCNQGMIVNRLYDEKELLKNHIEKNDIVLVDKKFNIQVDDIVLKTIDKKLIDELNIINYKKIPVSFEVTAKIGEKLKIKITDGTNNILLEGDVVDKAISHEVEESEFVRLLNKLGNTPFKCNNININKDENIFISLKNINELKRKLVDLLIEKRQNIIPHEVIINDVLKNTNVNNNHEVKYTALVRNEEQLKKCLEYNLERIYVTDFDLYKKYKSDKKIYYRLNRVNLNYDNYENENLLVCEIGSINKYRTKNNLCSDYFMNITNTNSIELLKNDTLSNCISVELSDEEISDIAKKENDLEMIIYGRLELMIMKYCPIKGSIGCTNCKNKNDIYSLMDKDNNEYPIISKKCITSIMHYKKIDKLDEISKYTNYGIKYFRFEFFDENDENIAEILEKNIKC